MIAECQMGFRYRKIAVKGDVFGRLRSGHARNDGGAKVTNFCRGRQGNCLERVDYAGLRFGSHHVAEGALVGRQGGDHARGPVVLRRSCGANSDQRRNKHHEQAQHGSEQSATKAVRPRNCVERRASISQAIN